MTTNALQSLYGGADAQRALASPTALSGNVGGQVRKQEVHTPDDLLDVVYRTFGGAPDYDPCAASDPAAHFARYNAVLPSEALAIEALLPECKTKKEKAMVAKAVKPYYLRLPGHLEGNAFVNPPFQFLRPWMEWCHSRRAPTLGLWPVRTSRPWWVRSCKGAEVVLLWYNVKFKGHKCAFPAALCLVAYGCTVPALGKMETGRWHP